MVIQLQNIKQILHGLSLDIAIYSLEVSDIQRREADISNES